MCKIILLSSVRGTFWGLKVKQVAAALYCVVVVSEH